MNRAIASGALALALGFAATPSGAQPNQPQPGMAPMAQDQQGQKPQGKSGCSCCQNMAMMQKQPAPSAPTPQ